MAATKYQVLYRATNPNTGNIITNDPTLEIKQVSELYHDEHKIAVGSTDEKSEATNEKNTIIMEDNDSTNPKYEQLYIFTGTKRINKKKWVPESTGYVIRDYSKIRDQLSIVNNGNYSGNYLLFEGDTPENGVVVSKTNPIETQYGSDGYVIKSNNNASNGIYYENLEEVRQEFINSTIGEIDFFNYPLEIKLSQITGTSDNSGYFTIPLVRAVGGGSIVCFYNLAVKIGRDMSFGIKIGYNYNVYYDYLTEAQMTGYVAANQIAAQKVALLPKHIKTYIIPAHWEESTDVPYCIHDSYEKVSQEPWFEYTTELSFTTALEKATKLVQKIGLENVKIIKVVPTDQFLKIK